jgi:membrane protein DedA with SNARE-associated domain
MMEDLQAWLQQQEGPAAYAALGLASLIEYVFPPFPGDTVALAAVILAATGGYHLIWVYVALNLGALVGGMSTYALGRWIGRRRLERMPRFLRGQQIRRAIDVALERFSRHGAAYLALNRFVPALRAVFFIAAGMAGLPWWKVAIWGTLSACAWNALLLGAGWALGDNAAQLVDWVETYSYAAVAAVVLVVLVGALRLVRAARRAGAEPEPMSEPKTDPDEP